MTTHCLEMVFICIFNNILCGNIYVPRLNTEIHSLVKLNSVLAQASRMSSKSAQKNVNVWTSTIPWQLSKLCPLKNTVWYSQKLHNRQASGSWWETGFDNCLTNKVDFFSNFKFFFSKAAVVGLSYLVNSWGLWHWAPPLPTRWKPRAWLLWRCSTTPRTVRRSVLVSKRRSPRSIAGQLGTERPAGRRLSAPELSSRWRTDRSSPFRCQWNSWTQKCHPGSLGAEGEGVGQIWLHSINVQIRARTRLFCDTESSIQDLPALLMRSTWSILFSASCLTILTVSFTPVLVARSTATQWTASCCLSVKLCSSSFSSCSKAPERATSSRTEPGSSKGDTWKDTRQFFLSVCLSLGLSFHQVDHLPHEPAPVRTLWRLPWWYRSPCPKSTFCPIFVV